MATLTAIQAEFQQDIAWFQAQVEVTVRTSVIFVEPLPAPILESVAMDLGDGFTLAPIMGLWELRREGVFIARFADGTKAINAALEIRFYLALGGQDMMDWVNEAVKRWGGVTL